MEKRIIEGALHIVEKQGVKFTMDELASELGMSKKTIYTVFRDKNELLIAMVDYVFDYIKESEALVMEDKHLSLLQKIRKILGVMPENYTDFDFTQFYVLRDKHPEVYERVRQRLESGWGDDQPPIGTRRRGRFDPFGSISGFPVVFESAGRALHYGRRT